MTTKLATITTQYRSFVNDQVLTADQLNTLINILKIGTIVACFLNGVGLACGFKPQLTALKEIVITQGCGLTTDGDLIQLQLPGKPESSQKNRHRKH